MSKLVSCPICNNTDQLCSLAEMEKRYVRFVLSQSAGRKNVAAKTLGIHRATLDRKLKQWLIEEHEAATIPVFVDRRTAEALGGICADD